MPVKKRPAKQKLRKVQVELPQALVTALDGEVHRARSDGGKSSRGEIIREMVGVGVVRRMAEGFGDKASRKDAMESLLKEAAPLAVEAAKMEAAGRRREAARLFLAAASREIEAISFMPPDDESGMKSAIIMALHHLKRGTGYSRLPDVQVRLPSRPSDEVQ